MLQPWTEVENVCWHSEYSRECRGHWRLLPSQHPFHTMWAVGFGLCVARSSCMQQHGRSYNNYYSLPSMPVISASVGGDCDDPERISFKHSKQRRERKRGSVSSDWEDVLKSMHEVIKKEAMLDSKRSSKQAGTGTRFFVYTDSVCKWECANATASACQTTEGKHSRTHTPFCVCVHISFWNI